MDPVHFLLQARRKIAYYHIKSLPELPFFLYFVPFCFTACNFISVIVLNAYIQMISMDLMQVILLLVLEGNIWFYGILVEAFMLIDIYHIEMDAYPITILILILTLIFNLFSRSLSLWLSCYISLGGFAHPNHGELQLHDQMCPVYSNASQHLSVERRSSESAMVLQSGKSHLFILVITVFSFLFTYIAPGPRTFLTLSLMPLLAISNFKLSSFDLTNSL